MAYILIIIGLAFLGTGVYMLASKRKPVKEELAAVKNDTQLQPKKQPISSVEENKQKGDDFEKFVVQQFDSKYFTLLEWRSDKYVNGVYAVSNLFPDLEINYKSGNIDDSFAVECKWRKNYTNEIQWADNYQLANYKKYSKEMRMQVFVILGVAGSPKDPGKIFIIPLSDLEKSTISKEVLSKYEKQNKSPFFWNVKDKQLY